MRFTKSILLSGILATSFVATADAQRATSSERYPRKKETATVTDTVVRVVTRVDTVYRERIMRDTIRLTETMPAPMVEIPTRGALYAGLGGTVAWPLSDLATYYEMGWGGKALVGYQPAGSPLGVRVDANYTQFNGARTFAGTRIEDAKVYSATANLTLGTPVNLGAGFHPSFYAIGGGGVHYFQDADYYVAHLDNRLLPIADEDDKATLWSLNGGVGMAFPASSKVDFFLESQFVSVHSDKGWKTNYVPATVGFKIFM